MNFFKVNIYLCGVHGLVLYLHGLFFWYRNSVMERIELFTNFNFESLCILTSAHFDDIDIGIDPVYDVGE